MNAVETQMNGKKKLILAKIDKVNSAAMKQAMDIFEQTGQYPTISLPTENTVSIQALQAALTREGDPYVWGAAGPSQFDCSGLVMWAYAQEGITLPHYTGWQWNSGVHVARSDLEPGDLVFFVADISHVGIYVGNGMMIDAPNSASGPGRAALWTITSARSGSGEAGSPERSLSVTRVLLVDQPQADQGQPGLVRVNDAYLVDNERSQPAGGDSGDLPRIIR